MVDFVEILLELQLKEANRCIQEHFAKGRMYAQFLSPKFLRQFPAIMDNQISVEWNSITGLFDWVPTFQITLINATILDDWCAHPSVWEIERSKQHSRWVLAMVHHTLALNNKGSPVVVYGVSFVYVPATQARTSMTDALKYLQSTKKDTCQTLVFSSASRRYVLYHAVHQWWP